MRKLKYIIFVVILFITIGFATINYTLSIDGDTELSGGATCSTNLWRMLTNGELRSSRYSNGYGVRPVITISKADLDDISK